MLHMQTAGTTPRIFLINEHYRATVDAGQPPLERGGLIVGLLLALVFAACLLAGDYFILQQLGIWWKLRTDGVTATAQIVNSEHHFESEDDWYEITFSYQDTERKTHTATAGDTNKRQSSTLDIVYLRSDPDAAWPIEDLSVWYGIGGALGAIIMLPLTIAYIGLALPRVFRHLARVWNGVLLEGRVLRHVYVPDDDGDQLLQIAYQFRTPSGREMLGEATISRRRAPPSDGAAVAVLYHDDDNYKMI